jgi:hypothetical protein
VGYVGLSLFSGHYGTDIFQKIDAALFALTALALFMLA